MIAQAHDIAVRRIDREFQDQSLFIVERSNASTCEVKRQQEQSFSIFSGHRLLFIEKSIFPVLRGV